MKLPVPSFLEKFGNKEKNNYYLALLLRDEKVVAVVIEEVEGKIKLIGRAEEFSTTSLEEIPYEELLNLLDRTISRAEETLPPQVQTEKTVFGVKDSWIEDKKIKKEYLSKLKKICDGLGLSPIGFMVVSEAIAHLLQREEGAPLSGIVAEIGKKKVTLSLFRAGKVVESHQREREDSLPKTVDKLLFHFSTHVLPSRIILLGSDDENLGQQFIAHQWSKELPFLHVPQIAVLPEDFDGKAMVYGAAEQMGFEVVSNMGELTPQAITPKGKTNSNEAKTDSEDEKEIDEKTEDEIEGKDDKSEKETRSTASSAEELGFVAGADIADTPRPKDTDDEEKTEEEASPPKETKTYHEEHHNLQVPTQEMRFGKNDSLAEDEKEESKSSLLPLGFIASLPTLVAGFFSKVPSFLPTGLKGGKMVFILPVALIIIVGLAYFYFFQMKAAIALTMQPQIVRETEAITLAAGSSNDFEDGTLAAKTVEVEVAGEKKISTTGKKEVGEEAKGVITLFNSSDAKRTVAAGTTLTSSNDLEFTTDKEVIIDAASGDIFSGIKSGTAKVNVTAKEIGTESNLPSNTKFSVASSNTLAGRNESAFEGGSKKEVRVVAQKDVDALEKDLPKSLEGKAKEALKEQLQSGEVALPVFTDISVSKKQFSRDVDEEANDVTLKATVIFITLSYNKDDIEELAQATLQSKHTQNLTISKESVKTELKEVEVESEDEVSTELVMEAGLLPVIEKDKITKELSGKSFSQAQESLAKLPQVKDAQIKLVPDLPFLPKFLPRNASNITLEVLTNE